MPDKNKNKQLGEEEYQLPDEEYVAPEASAQPENVYHEPEDEAEAAPKSKLAGVMQSSLAHLSRFKEYIPETRNKRILLALGLVVVLFIIVHFATDDSSSVTPEAVQTPKAAPVVAQQPNNQMLGSLDSLRAHSSRTTQKIGDMQAQISDLQTALTQTQSTNQGLQKSVSALSAQVDALSTQLKRVMRGIGGKKVRLAPSIVFHIRAIIPDRAWIASNTGDALSVTLGDQVAGYGVVRAINPEKGVISTSSGRNIYYGQNDF